MYSCKKIYIYTHTFLIHYCHVCALWGLPVGPSLIISYPQNCGLMEIICNPCVALGTWQVCRRFQSWSCRRYLVCQVWDPGLGAPNRSQTLNHGDKCQSQGHHCKQYNSRHHHHHHHHRFLKCHLVCTPIIQMPPSPIFRWARCCALNSGRSRFGMCKHILQVAARMTLLCQVLQSFL